MDQKKRLMTTNHQENHQDHQEKDHYNINNLSTITYLNFTHKEQLKL